jgi:hypothetical protein
VENLGTSLGAAAIALFVVKEVFSYLKTKGPINGNGKFHEYERWKAMEEALRANTHSIKNTTQILGNLVQITKDVKDEVKELHREIRK